MSSPRALAASLLAAGLLLGACGSHAPEGGSAGSASASDSMPSPPTATTPAAKTPATADMTTSKPATVAAGPGVYTSLATYEADPSPFEGSRVVLFFHAPWCPICRTVERSLEAAPLPSGLTVVKVDYDTENELRQRYGVTIQHTFVQIDPSGEQLAKWSTGTTADQILARTV